MTTITKILSVSTVAAALLGAGCVAGTVSEDEFCVTRHNVQFPGTTTPGIPVTMEQTFPLAISAQLDKLTAGAGSTEGSEIRVTSLTLTAVDGFSSFEFVDGVWAILYPSETSSETAPVTLVGYSREQGTPAESPLELPADSSVNLYDHLSSGEAAVTLKVTGDAPATSWTVDATICFALELEATL